MRIRTVLDGNAFYDIDEECMEQRRRMEGEKHVKAEKHAKGEKYIKAEDEPHQNGRRERACQR